MAKYLNDTGLAYFYEKLKAVFVKKESGKGLSTNDYTTTEKNKLSGIASGAEVNQNAFSNVKVGSTTVAADGKTDTLTLAAGSNVTITPDATNDKITIAAQDTTYSDATQSAHGLMNADDKKKLDGVSAGAQVNVIETVKRNGTALTVTDKAVDISVPVATTTTPKMDGTASVGSETKFAKGDHVHPSDTTKADKAKVGQITIDGTARDIVSYSKYAYSTGDVDGTTINGVLMGYGDYPTNTDEYFFIPDMHGFSTGMQMVLSQVQGMVGACAPIDSPYFTGSPKAPTPDELSDNNIATIGYVRDRITSALDGITGIEYKVVTTLPTTGEKGVIYLIDHSHGTQDAYDEYIWTGSAFEKIGSTDIDLSGYWAKADLVAITTSEIDTLFA